MMTWDLHGPDDHRAAYMLIQEAIRTEVIGHDEEVRALALAGARHAAGFGGQRLLLVGPSGVGKSILTRALAEALDVPWCLIDVTMMSEQNWDGEDIGNYLSHLYDEHGEDRAQRAVIVLDEIDKICVRDLARSSKGYRVGKQQSLLPLLGIGSEIPIGLGQTCRPDAMLIIGAGVFEGLPAAGPVGPGDLIQLGLIHEIVERMGTVIRLEPLALDELIEVLRSELDPIVKMFTDFGHELDVPRRTLAYIGSAVRQGENAGPRSGVSWLRAAADRRLVRLLEGDAPLGTRCTLQPDDVEVPSPARRSKPDDGGGERPPGARV